MAGMSPQQQESLLRSLPMAQDAYVPGMLAQNDPWRPISPPLAPLPYGRLLPQPGTGPVFVPRKKETGKA